MNLTDSPDSVQNLSILNQCFGNPISFWEGQNFLDMTQKVKFSGEKLFCSSPKKFCIEIGFPKKGIQKLRLSNNH